MNKTKSGEQLAVELVLSAPELYPEADVEAAHKQKRALQLVGSWFEPLQREGGLEEISDFNGALMDEIEAMQPPIERPDVQVSCACYICGRTRTVTIDTDRFNKWQSGVGYVQTIFHDLSANDRELLIAHSRGGGAYICPQCWDLTIGEVNGD